MFTSPEKLYYCIKIVLFGTVMRGEKWKLLGCNSYVSMCAAFVQPCWGVINKQSDTHLKIDLYTVGTYGRTPVTCVKHSSGFTCQCGFCHCSAIGWILITCWALFPLIFSSQEKKSFCRIAWEKIRVERKLSSRGTCGNFTFCCEPESQQIYIMKEIKNRQNILLHPTTRGPLDSSVPPVQASLCLFASLQSNPFCCTVVCVFVYVTWGWRLGVGGC